MKKQLLIGALSFVAILLANTSVKAQTANVTINLSDVISIDPSSTAAGANIGFSYPNEAAYRADQTVSQNDHLIITSTKAFDVKVKAGGENFIGTSGDATGKTIPISVLTIKVNGSSDVGGTASEVVLTGATEPQTLITNAPLGSLKLVDIDYFIPKERSSSDDILGKAAGDYKQTVTYSVVNH
ncbi:hypothetical protein [Albibacterium sp.]|uniref:hypothetical protein n=1 Tax=Albibacterium sp. TaxID=2952885 RepID=UPI002BBDCFCB|nr:hypothetical protein [Albibacterium sp.]HUH18724.1 hypothetical protein [Albibacterium sp.]